MKAAEIRAMKNGLFITEKSVADLQATINGMCDGQVRATCMTIVGIAVNTALEHVAELMDYDESQVASPEEVAKILKLVCNS